MASGAQNVAHTNRLLVVGSEKCSVESDIANIPSSHIELGQFVRIQILCGCGSRKNLTPDCSTLNSVGKWELDNEAYAAQEGTIQSVLHIGRKDCQSPVHLHTL